METTVMAQGPVDVTVMSTAEFAAQQDRETVAQEAVGVTVRLATITCRCGWKRTILKMYKCLYCGEWLCEACAEVHFGKTRAEYQADKAHNSN